MIFNSIIYPFFLVFIVTLYYLLPARFRWVWLLIASIAYYLSFIPVFFPLLVFLVILNYLLAHSLSYSEGKRRSFIFIFTVFLNILVLAFFKYFNNLFPGSEINLYTVDLFFRNEPINNMIMPLGLSYLIFTVLAYHIELKRKNIEHENHPGYFTLYLMFFPRIAQGPLERPQELIPQLKKVISPDYDLLKGGLRLILWGYFKKLVVADRLAIYVNAVYGNSEHHNGSTLIVATVFFAFQIYADFSGYTDIALGSARLFGIKLTDNFRRPYLATSIKDFWDRWHISFSLWLRDYLFSPLAYYFSRRMKEEKYLFINSGKLIYTISIMITFAICGVWHGVGWTFLLWGLLFGIYLTYSNWTREFSKKFRKKYNISKSSFFYISYKTFVTFLLVLVAWILFKASSPGQALNILGKILTTAGSVFYEKPTDLIFAVFGILSIIAVDLKREYLNDRFSIFYNRWLPVRAAGIVVIVLLILLAGVFDGGQFIYFQF
jgi:D-alanyl-lipoteichoic acid acyltransferase DltB (MBOAT superfamily)